MGQLTIGQASQEQQQQEEPQERLQGREAPGPWEGGVSRVVKVSGGSGASWLPAPGSPLKFFSLSDNVRLKGKPLHVSSCQGQAGLFRGLE